MKVKGWECKKMRKPKIERIRRKIRMIEGSDRGMQRDERGGGEKRGEAADQILWLSYPFHSSSKWPNNLQSSKALTFHEPEGLIVHDAKMRRFACLMK